jgi:predicted lipid-binding transport protein (Tim44 family)
MRRTSVLIAGFAALSLALAPGLALARAGASSSGAGASMGSRGSNTFSIPAPTNTAPSGAAPLQRSMTPQPSQPSYGTPGMAPSYGGSRSPFMSGLLGGLVGAGIGGLLFGGGLFHGISGIGSFLGLLLQIFLVVWLVRFLFRRFFRGSLPAFAGPNLLARSGAPGGPVPGGSGGGGPGLRAVPILPADFQAFEQVLQAVQAAWSNHDLGTLRSIATPEMASYFAEQLAEQTSRGVRNVVSAVKLEQGDLSEAWAEPGREYATVAMRFSMLDVTVDGAGRVVDGDPARRTQATEIWTFLRAPGGRWVLSAIQQTR